MTLINDIESLEAEARKIQNFLEITMSDDPTEAVQRGNDLIVYMSRTGKMLADAKAHLDNKMKSSIMKQLKEIGIAAKIPATTLNSLIQASCEKENYLVTWIDRLNRTTVHQLDWCRTVVSKSKEEMRLEGNNQA